MQSDTRVDFSLVVLSMGFVTALVLGFILPVKIMQVYLLALPGGAFIFPWTYGISSVVTEVWGYATARRMIWLGLLAVLVMGAAFWLTGVMAPAPGYADGAVYDRVFSRLPRVILSLGSGYMLGEFINALLLSKSKIRANGKLSTARLYLAPIIAQLAAYALFIPFTYAGEISTNALLVLFTSRVLWVVLYHTAILGVLVRLSGFLKARTHLDALDVNVDFNPFRF